MKCNQCGIVSADTNKFCPDCGFRFDASLNDVDRYLAAQLPEMVKAEVTALVKDQKIVEVEIAEAVATRLSNWGKLASYFLGACIAVLVVALGLVGIKSAADLRALAESVKSDVASKFEKEIASNYKVAAEKVSKELEDKFRKETETQINDVKEEAASLLADYASLKKQLHQNTLALTERVDTIEQKVDRFKIQSSKAVSAPQRVQLEGALVEYQKHLVSLGYEPETGADVSVEIRPNAEGALAYFDPSVNAIVVDSDLARGMDLTDLALREYGHRVMLSLNDYDPQNGLETVIAVQSGMVTFLSCSFRGKSVYGKAGSDSPLTIELTEKHKVSDIQRGVDNAMIDGSSAWGSLFWAIRKDIGQDAAERSLLAAWKGWKIDENASISEFAKQVLSEVKGNRDMEAETRVREMMVQWGINVK